ncbi:hypothetical protein M0R45_001935 [Rubus argutus]|uniref:Uncharacterized protein n=1 Tax=Rubus argutus TaxID=59490 RepID=A0AAW1VKC8_RUBAR
MGWRAEGRRGAERFTAAIDDDGAMAAAVMTAAELDSSCSRVEGRGSLSRSIDVGMREKRGGATWPFMGCSGSGRLVLGSSASRLDGGRDGCLASTATTAMEEGSATVWKQGGDELGMGQVQLNRGDHGAGI